MVRYFLAWFEIIHIKQTWDKHRENDISDHNVIFQRQVDNHFAYSFSGKKCHHQNGKFCGVTSMVYSMKRAHGFVVLCFVVVILSTPNNSYDIQCRAVITPSIISKDSHNRDPIARPWASCQIRKIEGAHAPGMPGTFSPSPHVSDPDMHHGTCVTHVPWCMPGSLTSGFIWNWRRGKTFPAFPAHAQPAILRIWKEAHEDDI